MYEVAVSGKKYSEFIQEPR